MGSSYTTYYYIRPTTSVGYNDCGAKRSVVRPGERRETLCSRRERGCVDVTQETPHRPPVRKVALDTIAEYGSIDDDLLVAMTHVETSAAAWTIRATIERMERRGDVYDAAGESDTSAWKVTSA